ncbi:MAG TPA: tetratricopeptide repeat protein [Cytophagales bacterium]|nr:tetratricopeptide repeat protein [Cytophagales bacterium]
MVKKIWLGACLLLGSSLWGQSVDEGLKYLDNEQYAKAKSVFTKLLEKKPIGDHYYYLGHYYNKIEEFDSARTFFEKGIQVEPKNGLNYAGLGIVQWLKGDSVRAQENFDKATSIRKRDSEVYYEIAKALTYSDYKSPTKAMNYIDQAIAYNKGNADYLLTKGDVFILKNNGTNAAENYNNALKINSKSVQAYIKKGKLYLRAKNTEEALKLYNQGISLDPNYAPGYRERSELYFSAKNPTKGLEDYKKYLEITDDNFDNNLRFARFLYKNKEYDKALEVAQKLEAKAANHTGVNRIIAYSYMDKGDYEKAHASLEKLFKETPEANLRGYDYDLLGDAMIKLGKDTAAAVEKKIKAAEMEPKLNKNYQLIGNMYYEKKKYDKAAPYFEKAYELGLLDFYGKLNYGKSYYYSNNYTKSNEVFTKLSETEPDIPNWFIWKLKSEVYLDQDYKTDNIKNAALKFIEATDKLKDKSQYSKYLAETYNYLGSYYCLNKKSKSEAQASWKKALEYDPKNSSAQNALNALEGCK